VKALKREKLLGFRLYKLCQLVVRLLMFAHERAKKVWFSSVFLAASVWQYDRYQ
jgi:hypothetical protein